MARYPPRFTGGAGHWRWACGLVIGVIAAVVIMIVCPTARRRDEERRQAHPRRHADTAAWGEPRGQDAGRAAGEQRPPPTPTPTAAVTPPPVLKEGDDCPDSTLAVKGITSQPSTSSAISRSSPWSSPISGWWACQRDVGAAVLAAYVYSLDNTGCGRTWTAHRRTRRWSRRSTPASR